MNADTQRRIRSGTSKAMRRVAKRRQCPQCERKMALRRIVVIGGVAYKCRYCDFEKFVDLSPPDSIPDSKPGFGR